ALLGPSAYFMKSPAIQYTDEQARLMTEEFIREFSQSSQEAAKPTTNGHHTEPVPAESLSDAN
ncbi:MAG TPA: hypothetical protein VGR88_06210, partial [Ktedonobacterales bacterium]|nr:hypothetical protein [Ktedonobacterales bacterium]